MAATLITLIPREGGILVQTMFFTEEVKALPAMGDGCGPKDP